MFSYLYNYFGYNQPTNFYFLSLIKEPDDKWSIHGLWPQNTLEKYPQFCNPNATFNLNKLDSIINRLHEDWYSNRGEDSNFWEHEYLKHGTCNFNNFDELEYFETTLDLFDRALKINLQEEYYNENTNKCLIPVNQQLQFFKLN